MFVISNLNDLDEQYQDWVIKSLFDSKIYNQITANTTAVSPETIISLKTIIQEKQDLCDKYNNELEICKDTLELFNKSVSLAGKI